MEVFPQTQGGVELWSGLLLLHARLVPYRLRRPTAPPSAWSVCIVIYAHYILCLSLFFLTVYAHSIVGALCLKLCVDKREVDIYFSSFQIVCNVIPSNSHFLP